MKKKYRRSIPAITLLFCAGSFIITFFIAQGEKQPVSADIDYTKFTIFDIDTMQEMTEQICENTTTPNYNAKKPTNINGLPNKVPTTTLIDTRDNKKYTVSKLADGNCWMTQNLDLGDTSTKGNTLIITSDDSDISPSNFFELPVVENYSSYNDLRYAHNGLGYSGGSCLQVPINAIYDFTAHPYYSGYATTYGNLYNWYTATSGTGVATATTPMSEATGSICPRGWQLPYSIGDKSYDNLVRIYARDQNSMDSLLSFPVSLVNSGYIAGNGVVRADCYAKCTVQNTGGLYWTNSNGLVALGSATAFVFNPSLTYSDSESMLNATINVMIHDSDGGAVRCVARGKTIPPTQLEDPSEPDPNPDPDPDPDPDPEPTPPTPDSDPNPDPSPNSNVESDPKEFVKKETITPQQPIDNPQTNDSKPLPFVIVLASAITIIIFLIALKPTRR